MKNLLQSRFVSNYGMIFVLMLLCAYFSVATIDQQNPVTVRAANKIVAFINDQPAGKNVLVVVPSGVVVWQDHNRMISKGLGHPPTFSIGFPLTGTAEVRRCGQPEPM